MMLLKDFFTVLCSMRECKYAENSIYNQTNGANLYCVHQMASGQLMPSSTLSFFPNGQSQLVQRMYTGGCLGVFFAQL